MALLDSSTTTANAAVAMGEFSISDGEQTTDDGTVSDVLVDAAGTWQYDLPSGKNAATWQTVLEVRRDDTSGIVATTGGEAKYLNNNGEWQLRGSILATDVYAASDFAAADAGETNTTDLSLRLWFQVFNPDETELARAQLSDTATVAVTDKEYDASEFGQVGGDGEIVIVG
jgi:hypothetical protein